MEIGTSKEGISNLSRKDYLNLFATLIKYIGYNLFLKNLWLSKKNINKYRLKKSIHLAIFLDVSQYQ